MKAVCLLSGGLDSCVAAAIAKNAGYEIYAITFDYGQRHRREIQSARAVAKALGALEHKIIKIDLEKIGGSSLTDPDLGVPEHKIEEIGKKVPSTYVPARNTIFLSIASGYAEVIGADAIFIGAHSQDFSGYPDCRAEYFEAFSRMINLGTRRGIEGNPVRIETPIVHMKKSEIIKKGIELKAPLNRTWSCYRSGKKPCGRCDSCLLRLKGFAEAGIKDPLEYPK